MALHCLQGEDQTTYHGIQSPSQTVAASLSRVIPTQPRADPPLRLPHPPNSRPVFHSCCIRVRNASSTSSLPDLPPSSSVASPRKESLHRTSLSLCFLIYQGDTHHARFVEFS